MSTTFLLDERPASKAQRVGQRPDIRGYPPDGLPWGQDGWGSGGTPPEPLPVTATHARSGAPGLWFPDGSVGSATVADLIAGVPVVIVALTSGGAASGATPWAAGQYCVTQDGGKATWGGTAWVAGVGAVTSVLSGTVAEVQEYVDGLAMDDSRDDIIQQLIDYERAHKNRTTLVTWLDEQTGVV